MSAEPPTPATGDLTTGLLDCVKAFEEAWQAGPEPLFEDFLDGAGPQRLRLLTALVQVALERRLQAGQAARVEEYLTRYPELASESQVLRDLVQAEYRCRLRLARPVSPAEYAQRFPELGAELPKLLQDVAQGQ